MIDLVSLKKKFCRVLLATSQDRADILGRNFDGEWRNVDVHVLLWILEKIALLSLVLYRNDYLSAFATQYKTTCQVRTQVTLSVMHCSVSQKWKNFKTKLLGACVSCEPWMHLVLCRSPARNLQSDTCRRSWTCRGKALGYVHSCPTRCFYSHQ